MTGVAERERDGGSRGFVAATRLVAEREMKTFLRAKAFWIGLGVIVVGLFAMSILPTVFGGGETKVATVGARAAEVLTDTGVEVRAVADVAEAEALIRSEEVEAAVVPD